MVCVFSLSEVISSVGLFLAFLVLWMYRTGTS